VTRWAALLLPVLGVLAFDPRRFDAQAAGAAALAAGSVAVVALALAESLLGARRRVAWTPLTLAVWAFATVRGAAALREDATAAGRGAAALLVLLAAAHTATLSARAQRWLALRAPLVLGTLGAGAGALAVGQLLARAPQASALFANRSFAGIGLAMLLPFALRSRRPLWLAPPLLLGLLATRSRAGALAAAFALLYLLAERRPRLRLAVRAGAALCVLALFALTLARDAPAARAIVERLPGDANSVKARLAWYGAALDLGAGRPLFGLGLDGFRRAYPPVRPLEEHRISGGRVVHAVHDDYLESFAETGIVGLLAHLAVLVLAARAARADRAAAASLLAFGVASLVDLPMRDPALLALAALSLTILARPARAAAAPAPLLLFPLLLAAPLAAPVIRHWLADREVARYFATRSREALDRALAFEPENPEALLERAEREDLERLARLEPNHGNALLRLGAHLEREDRARALAHYREILERRDPHHVLTRCRLAQLLQDEDPVAAVALLRGAIEADPRPHGPWLLLAGFFRRAGRTEDAWEAVRAAEARRPRDPEVAAEKLAVLVARFRETRRAEPETVAALRAAPPASVAAMVEAALARAAETKRGFDARKPAVERREGEEPAAHARRVEAALAPWRRDRALAARADYEEALFLAEGLLASAPDAAAFHLAADAARGLDDLARARRYEANGYLLEALDALRRGDDAEAARRLRRSFAADPSLPDDAVAEQALASFFGSHPGVADRAPKFREALAGHPRLAALLHPPR
jgi:O-antigen ligase